jgi:hypothetical protein
MSSNSVSLHHLLVQIGEQHFKLQMALVVVMRRFKEVVRVVHSVGVI